MSVYRTILVTTLTVVWSAAVADEAARLRPWTDNPWYWSYHGQPVLLVGGSDDDNLFQWPEAELTAQLDRLVECGGNVIRNTMSDRRDKGFEVYPFRKLDDGTYDLMQWNPEYWDRFERLLRETSSRGIFVQIEIWDRFDYTDHRDADRWQIHPYNPKNNVNYTYDESGFADRYPDHPGQNRQPFFFTTPEQRDNGVVLPIQQAFVNRMLDHSLQYDHVLYCMDNETNGEEAWGRYWATFVRQRAEREGRRVFLTEMWDDWNLRGDQHRRTFDHPELYEFVDVSQNNHNKGQQHWDNFLFVRKYVAAKPRPMNTTKIYGASGNKFGHNDQDAIERCWRHLLAGAASIRFHRPDSGLGLDDKAVRCIRAIRLTEQHVKFWNLHPANEFLGNRDDNEAYLAAADDGSAFVVYFPGSGSVEIDLTKASGQFEVRWIDIDAGSLSEEAKITGGTTVTLASPGDGNHAAVIVRASE